MAIKSQKQKHCIRKGNYKQKTHPTKSDTEDSSDDDRPKPKKRSKQLGKSDSESDSESANDHRWSKKWSKSLNKDSRCFYCTMRGHTISECRIKKKADEYKKEREANSRANFV